jgi:hypothetical protein
VARARLWLAGAKRMPKDRLPPVFKNASGIDLAFASDKIHYVILEVIDLYCRTADEK